MTKPARGIVGDVHAPASPEQKLEVPVVGNGRRDCVVVPAEVFFGDPGFILRFEVRFKLELAGQQRAHPTTSNNHDALCIIKNYQRLLRDRVVAKNTVVATVRSPFSRRYYYCNLHRLPHGYQAPWFPEVNLKYPLFPSEAEFIMQYRDSKRTGNGHTSIRALQSTNLQKGFRNLIESVHRFGKHKFFLTTLLEQ